MSVDSHDALNSGRWWRHWWRIRVHVALYPGSSLHRHASVHIVRSPLWATHAVRWFVSPLSHIETHLAFLLGVHARIEWLASALLVFPSPLRARLHGHVRRGCSWRERRHESWWHRPTRHASRRPCACWSHSRRASAWWTSSGRSGSGRPGPWWHRARRHHARWHGPRRHCTRRHRPWRHYSRWHPSRRSHHAAWWPDATREVSSMGRTSLRWCRTWRSSAHALSVWSYRWTVLRVCRTARNRDTRANGRNTLGLTDWHGWWISTKSSVSSDAIRHIARAPLLLHLSVFVLLPQHRPFSARLLSCIIWSPALSSDCCLFGFGVLAVKCMTVAHRVTRPVPRPKLCCVVVARGYEDMAKGVPVQVPHRGLMSSRN
mmetsp:Transcript_12223/g.37287  ORF Transcript_12223/g.37287 Transcript_12223/m.37287 type:complete len:374 (-) Transcript_12223:41-1162(-)